MTFSFSITVSLLGFSFLILTAQLCSAEQDAVTAGKNIPSAFFH